MLSAATVGVVHVVTGGTHCAALTHDNRILTWGANDLGALGRDTEWTPEANSDDDEPRSDMTELNPRECTPTAIDPSNFSPDTVFTQLAAGDSLTLALTDEGLVYGWGTFCGNQGVTGFSPVQQFQTRAVLIPSLKKITKIVMGYNHALAINVKGAVYAWGAGEAHQLGRRLVERHTLHGLVPETVSLPKGIVDVGAGAHTSYAVTQDGMALGWGLNTYGETGVPEKAEGRAPVILHPAAIESAQRHGRVVQIDAGDQHAIAVTDQGRCIAWGRADGFASGLSLDGLPGKDVFRDDLGRVRFLKAATAIPGLETARVAAGSEHNLAIAKDGKAYSWGSGIQGQTGQGHCDDIECAMLIDCPSVWGKRFVWAGAGAQFSVLAELAASVLNGER
ncbi:MAG: hypothetical protein M1826_002801 [Phylliscum demangeonii]|nr:MAG: hypothetical protein M1826_002801 [Phylliscum demangeonii]